MKRTKRKLSAIDNNKTDSLLKSGIEKLKVIELCSGLGGTKIGVEQTGVFEVIQSSEIDPHAIQTYFDNFGHIPVGDFSKLPLSVWKKCHVLASSLPCQSFSLEGNKKGLSDLRGSLFFDKMKIVKAINPDVITIENVPGMKSLANGKYFKIIIDQIKEAGYFPHYKILNSADFGVPQSRERLYIVAFKKDIKFEFPLQQKSRPALKNILEKNPDPKYFLTQDTVDRLVIRKSEYQALGHNFGFDLLNSEFQSRTLMRSDASKQKNLVSIPVGKKINPEYGIIEVNDKLGNSKKFYVRYLTPREYARLQGFPESYKFTSSESETYKQLGNAVSVPVITSIFNQIILALVSNIPNRIEKLTFEIDFAMTDLIKNYQMKIEKAKTELEKRVLKNELRLKLEQIKFKKVS